MDFGRQVAHMVSEALKDADGDRYEVAAKMSRLVGREVSKYMLDAWSSESREGHNVPFYMVPALETACDTHLFTAWLAQKRGGKLLIGKDALLAELGKMERLRDEASRKIRQLKKVMEDLAE